MIHNDLTYTTYRRIVKKTAQDAARMALADSKDRGLAHHIDNATGSRDAALSMLKNHPTRIIDYADTVQHWEDLCEDVSDPEAVLQAMADRGFEYDVWDIADAIVEVARDSVEAEVSC